jgi:shikimate dehydrogenase
MVTTKIFGLIGFPLGHSLSPAMHNAAFKSLGIDAEYHLFEISPKQLNSFIIQKLPSLAGANITVPLKELIFEYALLDKANAYLKDIGALNTIVKKEDGWHGYNTDIEGFQQDLTAQYNPADKRSVLLGAGGGAKAVAFVLARLNVKEIAVYDIDQKKALGLVSMIKRLFPHCDIYAVNEIILLKIDQKDLLINATPVGLKMNDPALLSKEQLHKDLFVYDLIYNPGETPLLANARRIGARCSNGLGMLLYQGARSFEKFVEQPTPLAVMRQALLEGLKKKG